MSTLQYAVLKITIRVSLMWWIYETKGEEGSYKGKLICYNRLSRDEKEKKIIKEII